jgi:hypothetical protein
MTTNQKYNINNLISLWKTVAQAFQNYIEQKSFSYCYILDSEWPNRIWLNESNLSINSQPRFYTIKQILDDDENIKEKVFQKIVEVIKDSKIPLSLSYWSDFENTQHSTIEKFGLVKKSEQIGMSLVFGQKFESINRISLKRIDNENEAILWSNIYPKSFGYKISSEILMRTKQPISYYLVYLGQKLIGTVITYETRSVIGIHGLGIIPEFRKQGFAEEVMVLLINGAIDKKIKSATLQSSKLGKNIYLKMGFKADFLMTNYVLVTTK